MKYTDEDIISALRDCNGNKAAAARKLGCDWITVYRRYNESDEVKKAVEDGMECLLDKAEGLISKNIELGIEQQDKDKKIMDSSDAKWLLEHKAKHRGYSKRNELTGADGVDFNFTLKVEE